MPRIHPLSDSEWALFDCPTCKSAEGEHCRTEAGNYRTDFHEARKRKYIEKSHMLLSAIAIRVYCGSCLADRGEPCRTQDFQPARYFHQSRLTSAKNIADSNIKNLPKGFIHG